MRKILAVDMVSGRTHRVAKVRLYPEPAILEARELQHRAMAKLQGTQLGLGFIGSIEWVLAARSVSTALENWLNRNNGKESADLLAQAIRHQLEAERDAQFVPVEEIANIHVGVPGTWRREPKPPTAEESRAAARSHFAAFGPPAEPKNPKGTVAYVHNGAKFTNVELEDGSQIGLEWSHVEAIRMLDNA